ncbi:MAG: RNA methyltransferase [Bacteroidota bacterium]
MPLADLLSMTRQRLKDLASLTRRKGRRQLEQFLVEGVRSVEAAIAAGAPLVEVLVAPEALDTERVVALVDATSVPVHSVAARELARIGDARTSQGVLAVSASIVRRQLEAEGPVMVLDGVQDPGNVGALVRSAAWFGVSAVVADARSADFEGPKAVRASMGGLWDLQLVRVSRLAPVLDRLRDAGRALWGADMHGTAVSSWRPSASDVLVLGNEGNGLSDEVAACLSGRVSIPGAESTRGVESLNVGVAAGVILHRWLG